MVLYKQNTLNDNKNIIISLQNIYGISWYKSLLINSKLGLNFILFLKSFNLYNLQLLFFVLDFFTWLEIRIKRYISQQIKKQVEILSYAGIRHKDNLPMRGQRTRTNACTRKRFRLIIND